MKMKRWTALALALLLCGAMAACQKPVSTQDASASGQSGVSPSASDTTADDTSAAGDDTSIPVPVAPAGPQAGANPLTGQPAPEGMAEGARPAAVMVDNSPRARPQRGIAAADVLVEMAVEDGTTRFLALYGDYRAVPQVGPVCPAQDQFLQMVLPLQGIFAYTGATQYVNNLLYVAGGYKTINGAQLGTTSFWFDEARTLPRLTGFNHEYCWFTDAALMWNGMTVWDIWATGEVPSLFPFATGGAAAGQPAAWVDVTLTDAASTSFTYLPDAGVYEKYLGAGQHMEENGTVLTFQNLLILSANIAPKADSQYLEYDFSAGEGWYFTAGDAVAVKWQKGGPTDALVLTDAQGRTLQVQPGKTYIGFVEAARENAVAWLSAEERAAAQAAAG